MHVESYRSRNWNVWLDLPWRQETHKQFDLCAPGGGLWVIKMVSEPLCSREGMSTDQDADKDSPGQQMKWC